MNNNIIHCIKEDYVEYLRDESRTIGKAESISFPKTGEEVIDIVKDMYSKEVPITIQGARTGLAAGAVPRKGHVLNLSKLNNILGMRVDEEDNYYVTLQPGAILSQFKEKIKLRKFDTSNWSFESKKVFNNFCKKEEMFFSPDPTETSATIGGMVSCNASGARSYMYGPTRKYIEKLKLVLSDGDTLTVERGKNFADGRKLVLKTDKGMNIEFVLPKYLMPNSKNASGYYVEDNMDAIDLFIGADGTLGIITEIEVRLLKLPEIIWGVSCFFENEASAIGFVEEIRRNLKDIASMEFFDKNALYILKKQKERNPGFERLPDVDEKMKSVVYLEIHTEEEKVALSNLEKISKIMNSSKGKSKDTWVAKNDVGLNRLIFFRHAVPESVNMLIDERKKENSKITKIGTDMSVQDEHLEEVIKMYKKDIIKENLESATWGHIGDNQLHVNILPRDNKDYDIGLKLYEKWAKKVTELGGAVSAEHGVGKLKSKYLKVMYGQNHIDEMIDIKSTLDPKLLLSPGNLFEVGKRSE